MKKLNIVYFGTPEFSVPALDMLNNHSSINISYVVSMPDRPAGRGQNLKSPEVIEYAKANKIPFIQTENINKDLDAIDRIKKEKVDVFVVLAFAQFLSQPVLDIPVLGCFNIHTSLLPKYRGAAPIQYAILNGDTATGVSIQKMVKKMDAGDLVLSHPVAIHPEETGGQLYTKLKFQAALSLNDFINNVLENNIKYESQNEDGVSFAPTLKKEDGFLDFKTQKYSDIKNRIRALYPWPGTYCFLGKKRLKVFNIEISKLSLKPGEVQSSSKELFVGCLDETIRITGLQLEGKKRGSDTDLLNGLKDEIIINP
jgi:methionyl-tRNA formyltransferase